MLRPHLVSRAIPIATLVCLLHAATAQGLATGFVYEPVVSNGLQDACSMAFAPDGRLFVCERLTGRVRVVRNGALEPTPWYSIGYTQTPLNESGLLGIAIDPQFTQNGYVYLYYTDPNVGENRIALVRDVGGVGSQLLVLSPPGSLVAHPNRVHNAGRMVFGFDGKLYVSVGDAENHLNPQDPGVWMGKVLRFDVPSLAAPADNPIPGNPVYARGMRNSFGLAVHPNMGWLYTSENGYLVGDEINRIVAGGNYGWPQYEGVNPAGSGFRDPLLVLPLQPVLTGLAFFDGPNYPAFQNELFVCQWLNGEVRRLTLSSDGNSILANNLFADHAHSFDIQMGPDGNLWILHGTYLSGADQIGRYVYTNAPSPSVHAMSVSGPSMGGTLTIGMTADNGDLLVPWLGMTAIWPLQATIFGPIGTPANALLPTQVVAADQRCYHAMPLPSVPSLVGSPVFCQALRIGGATLSYEVTNTTFHLLR